MNITGKGMKFRWLNNAGFEMELSSGKHLLVDPWLDEAQIYPISIDEIERADYVLLIHMTIIQTASDGFRSASHRQLFLWGICLRKHCVRNMT